MDVGLSYGLTEYTLIIEIMKTHGVMADQTFLHGGHLINLHIVAGLGLGGCEMYPGVFQPFDGYPAGCQLENGAVIPPLDPGSGLETKPELVEPLRQLLS